MVEVKQANVKADIPKPKLKSEAVRVTRTIEQSRKTNASEGIFSQNRTVDDMRAAFIYGNRTNAQANYYLSLGTTDGTNKANILRAEAREIQQLTEQKYRTFAPDIQKAFDDIDLITDADPNIQAQKKVEARAEFYKNQAELYEKEGQNYASRLASEMEFFTSREADAALLFLDSVTLDPQDIGYDDPLRYEQACILAAKEFAVQPLDEQGFKIDDRKQNVRKIAEKIYQHSINSAGKQYPFELKASEIEFSRNKDNLQKIQELYLAQAKEISLDSTGVKFTRALQTQKFDCSQLDLEQQIHADALAQNITPISDPDKYQAIVNQVYAIHLRQKAESSLQIPSSFTGDKLAFELKYHELSLKTGSPVPADQVIESLDQDEVKRYEQAYKAGVTKAYIDTFLRQAQELLDVTAFHNAVIANKFDISDTVLLQVISDEVSRQKLYPLDPANEALINKIKINIYANHLQKQAEKDLQIPQDITDQESYTLHWKQLYSINGKIPSAEEVRTSMAIDAQVGNFVKQVEQLVFEGKYARELEDNPHLKQYFDALDPAFEELIALENDPASSENDTALKASIDPLRIRRMELALFRTQRPLTKEEQQEIEAISKQISAADQFLSKDDVAKNEQRAQMQTVLAQKRGVITSYLKHIGSVRGMTPEFAEKIQTALEDRWYRNDDKNWNALLKAKNSQNWFWLLAILGAALTDATGAIFLNGISQAAPTRSQ